MNCKSIMIAAPAALALATTSTAFALDIAFTGGAQDAAAQGVSLDVAYIESTGAQYIDTGVTMVPGLKAELVASFANVTSDGGVLGGRTGTSSVNKRYMMLWIANSRFYFSPGPNYNTVDHGSPSFSPAANKIYSIVADFGATRQTLTIDGVQYMSLSEQDYVAGDPLNLYVFAGNWYGTTVQSMIDGARLWSLKLTTEAGVVVRDYVPARKNGIYGLWDKENRVFYGSSTSTQFVGVDLDVPFCESSSAQHIDTGIPGNPGVRAEATFAFTALGGGDKALLASWKSGSERCVMIAKDGTGAGARLTAGIDKFYNCEKDGASVTLALNQTYTVTADFQSSAQTIVIDGGAYDNDTVLNRSGAMADTDFNLHLFTLGIDNQQYMDSYRSSARLYSMRIWRDGALARDYVPARRGFVHGLYDKVSRTFVTSATSAPFLPAQHIEDGKPDYYAEWIESDGDTFIDTGVVGNPGLSVEADVAWSDTASANQALLVSYDNGRRCYALYQQMGCLGLGVNNALFYGNSEDSNAPYGYLADAQAGAPVTVAAGQRVAIAASLGASAQSMSIDGANVLNSGEQFPAVGSGRTLYLFAASTSSSSSGVTWTTAARVYSLRMSENGVPVRDFVPGVRNGKGCLYDRVTDKCYFDIAGTITAAAGLIGPPAGTPTRPKWTLSYIGSEGNAYIDTGIPGNPGVKAEVTFAFTDLIGNNKALLASWKSGSERCIIVARDGDTLTAGIDKFEYCEKNGSHVPVAINQPYTVTADFQSSSQTIAINGGGYGDDTILSRSAAMADTGRNLYLFTLSHADSRYVDSYRTAARIYSLKIWRDGELVRHYVPVIADNGGPYLFDKVTRTFHQGATSGLWDVGEVGERIQQGMSIVIR